MKQSRIIKENGHRLFQNIKNPKTKICIQNDRIIETQDGKNYHLIMIANQCTRFSIGFIEKTTSHCIFSLTIINSLKQISLLLHNLEQLQYWIKRLGLYGYATNLQQITASFNKIGKGNFASVFKLQSTFNTQKAMKMFQKKDIQKPKSKQLLINEIKVMRELDSPYLVKLQCIYQTDKCYYLQMEYFEESLKLYMKKPMSKFKLKNIMKNLLTALKQMKNKSVIHRDIKPDNIMVRKKGQANQQEFVIIDFGLGADINQPNKLYKKCGTPGFIAPEIINMSEKSIINCQCDIFSLGATFFYLSTGKKPFKGAGPKEILLKNKKLLFEQYLLYYMSDLEKDLVLKMMNKEPQTRISVQQALNHQYFQNQVDDSDVISEQNCDLSSKLKQIKLLDSSSMTQGIVFLYTLGKSHCAQNKSNAKDFTKIAIDSDFKYIDDIDSSCDHSLNKMDDLLKVKKSIFSPLEKRDKSVG